MFNNPVALCCAISNSETQAYADVPHFSFADFVNGFGDSEVSSKHDDELKARFQVESQAYHMSFSVEER